MGLFAQCAGCQGVTDTYVNSEKIPITDLIWAVIAYILVTVLFDPATYRRPLEFGWGFVDCARTDKQSNSLVPFTMSNGTIEPCLPRFLCHNLVDCWPLHSPAH